jgi:simple sugar transport system permease protein
VHGGAHRAVRQDPIVAYRASSSARSARRSRRFALNKATLICWRDRHRWQLRAKIINIGGEGQIAIGGLAATWAALAFPVADPAAAIVLALAGCHGGRRVVGGGRDRHPSVAPRAKCW